MRSSVVALVGLIGLAGSVVVLEGCSLSCTGNSCTAKTVPEFVDSSQPAKTAPADWNGTDEISIKNDGVNPLTGTGGIEVTLDANATKLSASANFAGRADTKDEADQSIKDAIATFNVTANTISCSHGGKHGTSEVATSGCKLLKVIVPAGSDAKPLKLKIGSGNGGIRFTGTATAASLTVDENGLGEVIVSVKPVKDAVVKVTGEDAVKVSLPSSFSAKSVILTVNSSTSEETAKRIITTAFSGMASNKPYPTDGAKQDAAAEINVQSKGLLDDDTVTIASF